MKKLKSNTENKRKSEEIKENQFKKNDKANDKK